MNILIIEPAQMLTVLEMRKAGDDYIAISKAVNLTVGQISGRLVKLKQELLVGNYSNIQKIAKYADVDKAEIISLIKHRYHRPTDIKPRYQKIKIKQEISNKKVWYNSHRGEIFEAKNKLQVYIVNGNELFKVRKIDCTEV